jgi:two-component sensor histidine kinase
MLGLGAALVTGRTVTGPMRKLERAAASVARGEAPMLPETDLPEIRQAVLALLAAHIERDKLLNSERQARLLEQNARLAAELANKTKDEFLAMLGHELRNPLAAISTAAQVLDQSDQAQRKDVEQHAKGIIRRQVRHLGKLTDDLLDAARVMMGKIVLDRRPVDLAQIVSNTIDTLRNTGQLQRHECATQLESVWVNVDPTRIDQVIANLLTNAIKYTPSPGRIEVSVRRQQGAAVFSVRDSGLGLEAELLPRSCTTAGSRLAAKAPARAASSLFICPLSTRPRKLLHRSRRRAAPPADASRSSRTTRTCVRACASCWRWQATRCWRRRTDCRASTRSCVSKRTSHWSISACRVWMATVSRVQCAREHDTRSYSLR